MAPVVPEPPSEPVLEPVLRCGRTSYTVVRALGPARHGELLLACRRIDERFGGLAVLKRPVPSGGKEAQRRLRDEARVLARLRHPNLPCLLQFEGQEDALMLVSEHVPGLRLERMLEASRQAHQPLSTACACYVAAEVADALHHAHTLTDEHGRALGIVHRDVTPYNILLGEHGEVKLLDFGAAWSRLSGRVGSEGPALQGSLAYAAPESVRGASPDGRADQFSLGLVLLRLLTGRHLFEGAERFDLWQRQVPGVKDEPGPLYERELARRIRDYCEDDVLPALRAVPAELAPLVRRVLAPDWVERFGSCAALAHALREHLRAAQPHFGRHELMAELATLRYVALRVSAGEHPDEAVRDRLIPGPGTRISRISYRTISSRLSARLRRSPRRR
ncbi:MAG TPA: protein kinase [Myxococcus sp.]|nr:protein kinase [Myxococcus sp.]